LKVSRKVIIAKNKKGIFLSKLDSLADKNVSNVTFKLFDTSVISYSWIFLQLEIVSGAFI